MDGYVLVWSMNKTKETSLLLFIVLKPTEA